MVRISTMFVPYKLVLSERKPVILEVTVKNTSSEPKLMSVLVEVPYDLSLNSGGYMRRQEYRIGMIKPGEERKIEYHVFAKPTTLPGTYEINITVFEHMDDYEYVAGETKKTVTLRVV